MFAAHNTTLTPPFYRADNFYRVMGCTEQYQICPTGEETDSCTTTDSRFHVYQQLHEIGLNEAQIVTAELIMNISETANIFTSVFGIGSAALLAHDLVFQDLLSEGLPNNQWELEAVNFFAISLARLQASVLQFSSKSSEVAEDQHVVAASTDQQKYLCNNQKIRDIGGYESFTAAAVWFIIIVGLIILILGATIDSCFAIIQKRFHWQYHRLIQWKTDNKFQQQRIAMYESGYGSWTGATDEIPLTERGDVLAVPMTDRDGMTVYRI